MRIKADPVDWEAADIKRHRTWTKWFAWYPVRCKTVDDQPDTTVWFEYVYRRYDWIPDWDRGWWTPTYMTPQEHDRLIPY